MIAIDNTLISEDIIEKFFVCDLIHCKGACCVEGDLGAPLAVEEVSEIDAIVPKVLPYLSKESVDAINKKGAYVWEKTQEYATATLKGKECVFAFYDSNNILKCGFEAAWKDGKTQFKKPISCHLYPIRVSKIDRYEALNYDKWHICQSACSLGKKWATPLYIFLKEALIRKFGKPWYQQFVDIIRQMK